MALVLKRLYAGELLNADHTRQLLGHMPQTNEEELYLLVQGMDAALLTCNNATFALVT